MTYVSGFDIARIHGRDKYKTMRNIFSRNENQESVNNWVNNIVGKNQANIKTKSGRLIEEAYELARACGMKPSEIHTHLLDSIYNECKKHEMMLEKKSHFPKELEKESKNIIRSNEVEEEIADVLILLFHIADSLGVNVQDCLNKKMDYNRSFKKTDFAVLENGLFYRKKKHI